MRLLLDTHILIWAMSQPTKLPPATRQDLSSRDNEILFSPVSVFEVAIKFALRRPDFSVPPEALIAYASEMDFVELPVVSSAAALVASLPPHHRDPFDRLLVTQAMSAGALLLTSDAWLSTYAPHIRMMS